MKICGIEGQHNTDRLIYVALSIFKKTFIPLQNIQYVPQRLFNIDVYLNCPEGVRRANF